MTAAAPSIPGWSAGAHVTLRWHADWPACAISRSVLAEVWPEALVSPLPLVGAGIAGLVARRGEVVGLFDIASWLGLSGSKLSRVVCLHMPHGAAALWTCDSPELVTLEERLVPATREVPVRLLPFMHGTVASSSGPVWRFDASAWFEAVTSGASPAKREDGTRSLESAI